MTYIDFYVMKRTEDPQDFRKARTLVANDDEAQWFIDEVEERFTTGPVLDDLDELGPNGEFILQYHNGIGDGGVHGIVNCEWFAKTYPAAFKLLGITISWGKGTSALTGNPTGVV